MVRAVVVVVGTLRRLLQGSKLLCKPLMLVVVG